MNEGLSHHANLLFEPFRSFPHVAVFGAQGEERGRVIESASKNVQWERQRKKKGIFKRGALEKGVFEQQLGCKLLGGSTH